MTSPTPIQHHRRISLAAPVLLSLLSLGALLASSCQENATTPPPSSQGGSGGAGGDLQSDAGPADAAEEPAPASACAAMGLPERPFSAGPYGAHRHDVADDFTLELTDGTTWNFKEKWSGCESYIFVPNNLVFSQLNTASIWEKDLGNLLKKTPDNVHYFFIAKNATEDAAKAATDTMTMRVNNALVILDDADAAHWRERLHVAAKRAGALGNWVGDILGGIGAAGFAIDRFQTVRGLGNLADVNRYKIELADAMMWPWESNLAYAAHEAIYFNGEFDRQMKLEAAKSTTVPLYKGEVLAEFAETDIDLPSAAEMAAFDTLQIEVDMRCPDPDKIEFGNCGAWDYLAYLFVRDEATMQNIEVARFITSYHRETHWVMDVTPMLPLLRSGGKRHFRWEFAPPWNTQPTETRLSLHLSNRSKGYSPASATYLFGGGAFGSTYNAAYSPIDVPIPADAKRVELVAVVTGHGAETNQCAEFCNHQHEFTVNGTVHLKEHVEAGTKSKCVDQIANGMVPNQGGTWWYGRGGWCPGEQVAPWVVDVTADVTPGQSATVSYRGLFGTQPPPDGSGNIVLNSYLVVYK